MRGLHVYRELLRRAFVALLALQPLCGGAQTFIDLTAEELKIDSVLPHFSHSWPLPDGYRDSTYSVSIEYPEFIDMSPSEVLRLEAIIGANASERFRGGIGANASERLKADIPTLGGVGSYNALPVVDSYVGVEQRRGTLYADFVPIVFRDGKWQQLVSFCLKYNAREANKARRANETEGARYAPHSVLSAGQWAKISVPSTGVYQLTEQLVRQAGFSSLSRVKVYGYGGTLQPETLTGDYLRETDDLKEVPQCVVGGRHFFHATGPVSWSSATANTRTRNPYSDYGCYFITESDGEPLLQDSAEFVASFYPTNDDYHSLYEVDNYAWYHSGRNLYDGTPIDLQRGSSYHLDTHSPEGRLTVVLSYDGPCSVEVTVGDSLVGTINATGKLAQYVKAFSTTHTYEVKGMAPPSTTVTLRQTSGDASVRLDYIALTLPTAAPRPDLTGGTFPVPVLNYRITNQDHHADPQADMVIIIPTSQKLLTQAQRLKELHEELDTMKVNIVPADELYNEFSSGTPDANAYRRYMKMLYDRADTAGTAPRYLLLMGDGTWDNRMLTTDWSRQTPDDFLLCFESEESFSETESYVADEYYAILDDGEGGRLTSSDRLDIGVGRLTARTEAEARVMVDKIEGYRKNLYAGDWQSTVCIMADDGNNNQHMKEATSAANTIAAASSDFNIKKVFWDAYNRVTTSTGNTYPDVTRLLKQQMQHGALIMDYNGHGRGELLSHEKVLTLSDFEEQTSLHLPLWVTASCDVAPFDSAEDNIGEAAMSNPLGGAIAFLGTTRTVYMGANEKINCAFLKHVLDAPDGRQNTFGDAVRLAKNAVQDASHPYNKLHFQLLGDPALRIAMPRGHITVDSIAGLSATDSIVKLKAGQSVTVVGHIDGGTDFIGTVALTVKDVEEEVVCKLNKTGDQAEDPFVFTDRPTTLYQGNDSIRGGRFAIDFVLPTDVSYSEATGLMTLYAVSSDMQQTAKGRNENFNVDSSAEGGTDGIGPSVYCYLNSPSFTNGNAVNTTPYFYAELSDNDGINASGSGIGHEMTLVVDGDPSMTYTLNNYFQYDFGDYRNGSVGFSLPEMEAGDHSLTFRAWDVFNNSSVAELAFRVEKALTPKCFSVACTSNPARTSTKFIVSHDRTGSQMDVTLEVFDTSGRILYSHSETGVSADGSYVVDWDLTSGSGSRLHTGVYLYRVLLSSDGSREASKAHKIIIL